MKISKKEINLIKIIKQAKKKLDKIKGKKIILCGFCNHLLTKEHKKKYYDNMIHPISESEVYERGVTFDKDGYANVDYSLQ